MVGSAQIRWQRSADRAISFTRFDSERLDLARCLAGRLLNPRGHRDPGGLAVFALQDRARYERAIAGILDDFSVRLSLAAKHLHLLHETVMCSDYEDVDTLTAEANWTRMYYESMFQCPIPMSPEWDYARVPMERRSRSLEEFLGTLEGTIVPHLHAALDSAA